MYSFAHIVLGTGEAVACASCGPLRERQTRPADEIVAEIAAVAAAWPGGPGPNVAFVGSEPFAHPDLPRVIQAAVDAGCERIRLRTDGGALAVAGNAAGAFHAGVRHLELVLLAGDAATHDRLVARPGLFDAALAGAATFAQVAQVADSPVAITGYVPVCRHNASALPATVLALARAGAVAVLAEPVSGYEIAPQVAAAALLAATVARVALHGPGVAPFSAGPWHVLDLPGVPS